MIELRNILVPTDFSEPADRALDYAKILALEFSSHLHLVHVVPVPQIGWAAESDVLSWSTFLANAEANSRVQLERLVRPDDPLSDRVTTAVMVGVPLASLLDYVSAQHIDLIVMGTHGRGGVSHLLLGSVAERVVRFAPVPVLTIQGAPPSKSDTPDETSKQRSPLSVTVL